MEDQEYSDRAYLHAFMKTAQYLASLTTHEDVWQHIAEVMLSFYGAQSAGFAGPKADGELEFHHLLASDEQSSALVCSKDVQESIREVLETGFLSLCALAVNEELHTYVLLPISLQNRTTAVMLVGHATAGSISKEVLNVYLSVAGLAGTTISRLISETELKEHRSHLEKLVSKRTAELTRTLSRLEREITEHMRAEEELRKYKDRLEDLVEDRTAELGRANHELRIYSAKLERINQELEEFAFVASHDLQEPLRKIQTFCDMALKRCEPLLRNEARRYLDRVLSSAGRMRQLLNDLLQFSRVAASPEPLRAVDLGKIAREAADVFETGPESPGPMIEIADLPTIEADEGQMLRLFQNLIGNALKFHSGERPRVVVCAKLNGDVDCEISVRDNGIGFDQQFAELIFKPFQRLHHRDAYEGTGMGLTICRKIVERHGGSIRVESESGKGANFIIRLPVKQPGCEAGVADS